MIKDNLPLLLFTGLLVGAMAMTSAALHPTSTRQAVVISFLCVVLAALAGWLGHAVLPRESENVKLNEVQDAFDELLAALRGHVQDHQVRPYDPDALGVRLAGFEAAITQIYNAAFTPPKTVLPLPATSPEEEENDSGKPAATPKAKELAEKRDLNVENIPGTGKNGRVKKKDVQKLLKDK